MEGRLGGLIHASTIELENAIIEHPAVLEAVVVGVPDPRWEERP
ncbi:AMP-binding enzyme, partial [Streptomyces tanashiensis]